jgi:molecular chaperone DnaK
VDESPKRGPRKGVSLSVKLHRPGVDDFVEQYATNISKGGFFIRTRQPEPVGSEISFRVEIADGRRVLQGSAMVQWARLPEDPGGPPGMGLAFKQLDDASRALIDTMLAEAPAESVVVDPSLGAVTEAPRAFLGELPQATEKTVHLDLNALLASTPEPPTPKPAPQVWALPAPKAAAPVQPPAAVAPAPDAEMSAAATVAPEPRRLRPAAKTPSIPGARKKPLPIPPARAAAQPVPAPAKPKASSDTGGVLIAIDIGTTNSSCAVLVNGKPRVLTFRDGYSTVPSVVAPSKHGDLVAGHRARPELLLNPAQSVYGAKRLVGRDYVSPVVQQMKERFAFQLVAGHDGRAAVELGSKAISLEEVQGALIGECRDLAEVALGKPVTRAVLTCPAAYSEPQREALRRSAGMVGLKVERVLNEPTAAALAYGLNRGLSRKILVYHLGGGTFDATVLRIDDNVFEVLATGGDPFLGGQDFDALVVDELLARFQRQCAAPFAGDLVSLSRVMTEAERARVALSERTEIEISLPMLQTAPNGKQLGLRTRLTRHELNGLCGKLVDRTLELTRQVVSEAKLKPELLDDVILLGGLSRMPLVRERLQAISGKAPRASVSADEAVALGAALFTGTIDTLSSVVLIDVVPMTIGVGLPGGGFRRIIARNAPLPAAYSFMLTTSRDNEQELELSLFQGEDAQVLGNEYLGTLHIHDLPRLPAGLARVMVTVRLDAECVLHVEAREWYTKARVHAAMATRYSPDEIRQRLGIPERPPPSSPSPTDAELSAGGGRYWSLLRKILARG